MAARIRSRIRIVTGHDGAPLTPANLPAEDTIRWVPKRKAIVVAAVRGGLLSFEEACDRYKLTADEFLAWRHSIDRQGVRGLQITKSKNYRCAVEIEPLGKK